jgi:periplasmic protein TonB
VATPQPEAQQHSAQPTMLGAETRTPQVDGSAAPATPQAAAAQQPPSATVVVPETRPFQADRSAPAAPQPQAAQRSESLTAPIPETTASSPNRPAGLAGQSGRPQQAPTPTAAGPETPSSGAERAAPVTPQAEVKQQPQPQSTVALAPPAGRSDRSANGTPPQMPKPPSLAKAPAETGASAVMERFAQDVQQAGSQVLDERDYPSEARDKKWEGTTQIEVRYAEGGYIRSIVVAESSGYPALDETAVQIARNIRLPNAPEELRSRDFAVRFPIVFRLRKP